MQRAEMILSEMESLLDSLLVNAKKLLTLSQQVIEEDELMSLQQEQETLLATLIKKDADFHCLTDISEEKLMKSRLRIDQKIDEFQKLNTGFLENISTAHGLIQFNQENIKGAKNKSKK